jgi:hypothetical protein
MIHIRGNGVAQLQCRSQIVPQTEFELAQFLWHFQVNKRWHSINSSSPSISIVDFWQWRLLNLSAYFVEQIWRNIVWMVNINNFSSNIFPSTP